MPIQEEGLKPRTHEQFVQQLELSGLGKTAMGTQWLQSAREALSEPVHVLLPYAESGGFLAHRAAAQGLVFDAFQGQTLHFELQRRDSGAGEIFVELFLLRQAATDVSYVKLRTLQSGESSMAVTLPRDGSYLVRLQPELLTDVLYSLSMELDAAILFPVRMESERVGSFFGDPRDAGSRVHEGIDIFAPRNTPVIAVADGRAVERKTPRGGNVVWLRSSGRSYYYAHLEEAAFDASREVEAGEVLGFIGNSGNAITTPTHLHFGIYRRGSGAVDPLPRLAARRFDGAAPAAEFSPRYVRTHAGKLNLRAGPTTDAEVLRQLDAGSVLFTSAARGSWLRVVTPDDVPGWIHGDYQQDPSSLGTWALHDGTLLFDSPGAGSRPVALASAGSELQVIGHYATHVLLRSPDGRQQGWAVGPLPPIQSPDLIVASGDEQDEATEQSPGIASGG